MKSSFSVLQTSKKRKYYNEYTKNGFFYLGDEGCPMTQCVIYEVAQKPICCCGITNKTCQVHKQGYGAGGKCFLFICLHKNKY